ncbi:MAG: ABC transporter permease [Acidobacteria bacterium]|nr:ABC transporter permease [Acidobacteriota bacterium]
MSFELRLAFKYFRARKKSLARFTAAVAVVGLAAGVASLVFAQALAQGFADEMRDRILANTAQIAVSLKDGAEIPNAPEIAGRLKAIENVREVVPTALENALLASDGGAAYAILKVRYLNNLTGNQIFVGRRLAEKLNLKPGDTAELLTLENQTPSRVRVAEIFETGLYDYDAAWVYVAPEKFARLANRAEFAPTLLNVSVADIYRADATAREIRAALDENFRVVDWQEANRPLFAALGLERKMTFLIISLIILVAALNITTTLALLVNERRLDIAVLRTCGAKTRNLTAIFLIEGMFLGLTGIFGGLVLGLLGCWLANYFRLVGLPADVYTLEYIPLHPSFGSLSSIAASAFGLSLAATFYPAFKASRLKPLENLRTA